MLLPLYFTRGGINQQVISGLQGPVHFLYLVISVGILLDPSGVVHNRPYCKRNRTGLKIYSLGVTGLYIGLILLSMAL